MLIHFKYKCTSAKIAALILDNFTALIYDVCILGCIAYDVSWLINKELEGIWKELNGIWLEWLREKWEIARYIPAEIRNEYLPGTKSRSVFCWVVDGTGMRIWIAREMFWPQKEKVSLELKR
jgi:hypothetical protein